MLQRMTTQELVEVYCQQDNIRDGLLYVQEIDMFYAYDLSLNCYLPLKQLDFERKVYGFLSENIAKNISAASVKDFVSQIKYRVYKTIENIHFDYIALKDNSIIDAKSGELVTASRDKMCFHHIQCDPRYMEEYKEKLPERFAKFLDEVIVFPDHTPDKETQMLLQEMVGYYLLNTLEAHAVFFLVGKGRNGKSVMLDLIREMIGRDFYSAMNVETLTSDQFSAAGLVGKKMNIVAEDESSYVRTDKFKAMIAGDDITVQRKYGSHFTWKPTVKHLFATNEMPSFSGFNVALTERIKIIPFNRYFKEDERDTQLFNKLKTEMAGIVAWAIAGAKRLRDNKFRFSKSAQSQQKADEFRENISSGVLFFNEQFIVDSEGFTLNDDLYNAYKMWAESRGKKKQSFYSFFKDIETLTGLPTIIALDKVTGETGKGKKLRRQNALLITPEY